MAARLALDEVVGVQIPGPQHLTNMVGNSAVSEEKYSPAGAANPFWALLLGRIGFRVEDMVSMSIATPSIST
jgi:hypothetical protein